VANERPTNSKLKNEFLKLAKEEEDSGRSSWSDNQSHASHSTQASSGCHSSPAEFHWDESTKWPTSFWTQFKVFLTVISNMP
jgi:hypothetical protein